MAAQTDWDSMVGKVLYKSTLPPVHIDSSPLHIDSSPLPTMQLEHFKVSWIRSLNKVVSSSGVPLSALFPLTQEIHIHTLNYSTNINDSVKSFLITENKVDLFPLFL